MRIVADESFDMPIVRALRAAGHDILSIQESRAGADDTTVLALAHDHSAVLFTSDHDFGELVFRLGRRPEGKAGSRCRGAIWP